MKKREQEREYERKAREAAEAEGYKVETPSPIQRLVMRAPMPVLAVFGYLAYALPTVCITLILVDGATRLEVAVLAVSLVVLAQFSGGYRQARRG